jgi:hypothetical protein
MSIKKKWGKPLLQVLTRGENKESVLQVCKKAGVVGAGADSNYSECWSAAKPCTLACDAQSAS